MPDPVALDVASLSHPGMVRPHNEDAVFVVGGMIRELQASR